MFFDENDSQPMPAGRQQDPYANAPPGYTIPIDRKPIDLTLTTPGTTSATPPPSGTPTTPPPGEPSFPAPEVPNPHDYPAPALPFTYDEIRGNAPHVPTPPGMPDPLAPWTGTFTPPTKDSILNDPEFQARMENGIRTIQRSAAAKGTLLTGGTLRGLDEFGQQEAGKAFGNAYNRAYNEYDTRRTDFLTNEANRFSSQKSNALDDWQNQMGKYQMERLNRGDTFDESAALFGMMNTNRMNSWGIGSDYWNMGRTNRMDDFGIFNTTDMNNWKKQMDIANLGKPQQPNAA